MISALVLASHRKGKFNHSRQRRVLCVAETGETATLTEWADALANRFGLRSYSVSATICKSIERGGRAYGLTFKRV